jgi:Mg2+ and Co2+ transporter CorA
VARAALSHDAVGADPDDDAAARREAAPAAGGAPREPVTDLATGAPPLALTWIGPGRCDALDGVPDVLPERGYAWVDAHYEHPRAWVAAVEKLTGVAPLEDHLSDAENPTHPSYFDSTRDYEMIVFRGLAFRPETHVAEPIRIRTRPTVFFLFPRCVVSVRPADSAQVPALRARLLEAGRYKQRLPSRPEELMLRILNGMVDRYLDLRQPLTEQLEHWQRELLDPRRPFRDWVALLESRRQLRKLENLSEEQLDALQEWRDERLDRRGGSDEAQADWADATGDAGDAPATAMPQLTDALEVRVNDLVEHIQRVLGHARRLETSVESAVQLHFSATAHRTNQIMRTLTVLTAVFMPLNLITGIFGMNFDVLPGIHSPTGFWWTMAAMAFVALALVVFFRTRRYLEETGLRGGGRRGRRRGP